MTIFDIAFDSDNHDMFLDGSDISFTDETNVVLQRVIIKLQFLFDEWFLDITQGIPYTQFIFEAGTNLDSTYGIIYSEIKNTEGVDTIESLTITPNIDNRTMIIRMEVNRLSEEEVVINI